MGHAVHMPFRLCSIDGYGMWVSNPTFFRPMLWWASRFGMGSDGYRRPTLCNTGGKCKCADPILDIRTFSSNPHFIGHQPTHQFPSYNGLHCLLVDELCTPLVSRPTNPLEPTFPLSPQLIVNMDFSIAVISPLTTHIPLVMMCQSTLIRTHAQHCYSY